MKVQGIFPPLVTPFSEAGEVDDVRLRSVVAFLRPFVHGLFVCGTYGSGPLLSPEERQKVFEVIADEVNGALPLIVQVGAANTATALRLAQHAQDHGAVAVAAVPPYYFSYNERSLREYFIALIRSVSIPVYAYDNPKTTGNPLSPTLLNELAGAGLAGLKDSSFDISKLYLAMRTVRQPDFDFVIGSESLMLPAFAMGVRGCIAGLSNVFPEAMYRFYNVVMAGNPVEAQIWQKNILRLWDVLHIGPSVPTAYTILCLRGIDAGYPRRPLLPLDQTSREKVKRAMEELSELWQID